MKLLTFYEDDRLNLGLLKDSAVINLTTLSEGVLTPEAFFADGLDAMDTVQELAEKPGISQHSAAADSITYGPAVPQPGKVLCIGLNYVKHAEESGMALPKTPVCFGKFSNSIAAHGEAVPVYSNFTQTDYESELVVVIGREARGVSEADALDYVLGYCNGNDVSERDLQLNLPGGQWLMGKTPDKFMPVGPYLVTADEIADPDNLRIQGWLNGELRQDSNTSDMIFSVSQIIAYVTQFLTLMPGDIISTGTPEGVIMGREEKIWLKDGDEYIVEIEGLGRLVNPFKGVSA